MLQVSNVGKFSALRESLEQRVVGQSELIRRLIIAVLADGHLLVEGAPGLAKTTVIKELARQFEGSFQRIQFTPDLLPADLTGTDVFLPREGKFEFQAGPIFHSFILADEINRAPAKVQSALLEAMGERQVTVGRKTYPLPEFFLVMATQNPIEQEGTYALPEAQLDRFLMHVRIGYPDAATEAKILRIARETAMSTERAAEHPLLSVQDIFAARKEVLEIHVADTVEDYLIEIVQATRGRSRYGAGIADSIAFGASPRGTIALERCARAQAWLEGRDYVVPEDLHAIVKDVLRHRVLLHYEAEASGLTSDKLIDELMGRIPPP